MSVGRTIKLLRVAAGLDQRSLADRLDVTPNYLSLVENDRREPSLSFLKSLSSEMRIPLGLIFLEVDEHMSAISAEERALLIRIQDLVFQIEQMRLHNEATGGDGH
jgi:transcriptional regulator with XRE-family HTH domain